jgi:hypothetical protein
MKSFYGGIVVDENIVAVGGEIFEVVVEEVMLVCVVKFCKVFRERRTLIWLKR